MEFDIMAIKSVTFRLLFSVTVYPQPVKQLAYEIYGNPKSVSNLIGMVGNLQGKNWDIFREDGCVGISDADVRLLNDYERYVIKGDVSKITNYGVTCDMIAKMVSEAKAVLV